MTMSPFDHEPDPELGRMLREHLTGREPEAFLARLRVAIAESRDSEWDVLAGWARPRAMAVAVAAGFLLWLGAWFATGTRPNDPGVMVASVASVPWHSVVNQEPPRADEIMGVLLEGR